MLKNVKIVRTHSTLFADGWAINKDVLPGEKTIPGLKMIRVAEGVEVSATGLTPFLIPWGNIKTVHFSKQEEAEEAAKASS